MGGAFKQFLFVVSNSASMPGMHHQRTAFQSCPLNEVLINFLVTQVTSPFSSCPDSRLAADSAYRPSRHLGKQRPRWFAVKTSWPSLQRATHRTQRQTVPGALTSWPGRQRHAAGHPRAMVRSWRQ